MPKIVDYIGLADGIIITANVSGNDGWIKQGEKVTLSGIIKTYSGGIITKATITRDGTSRELELIEGKYMISDITQTTEVIIYAEDSNKKYNNKNLIIEANVDGTMPTVESVTVTADEMNILISAIGHDKNLDGEEESGIDYFTYRITTAEESSLNGIEKDKREGKILIGEKITIPTTTEATYTVIVTATDKVGNGPSAEKTATVKIEVPSATKQIASDGEWWLPKDFIESEDSSQTIQGGKVIEDKSGNQWVWIPCYLEDNGTKLGQEMYSKAKKYERKDFVPDTSVLFSYCSDVLEANEINSIKKYGGFYIGRYEAGNDGLDNIVIRKNQIPYNNITVSDSKIKSNEFSEKNNYNTNKVFTKLVSSYVWDTTLCFIQETVSDYITYSPQGDYIDTNYASESQILNTGLTIPVCNIYDMGGNLLEANTETAHFGDQRCVGRRWVLSLGFKRYISTIP